MTGGVLSLLTVPELVAQFRGDVIRAGSAWNLASTPSVSNVRPSARRS